LAASSTQASLLVFDETGQTKPDGFSTAQVSDNLSAHVINQNGTQGSAVPAGGATTTMDYVRPYDGTTAQYGWVAIYEPGANGTLSDLVHFDNSYQPVQNGPVYMSMFFYSIDGDKDSADHWPDAATLNTILASGNLASITEDANGIATYTPAGFTSPGYQINPSSPGTPAGYQNSYEFISAVPEPTTMIAGALLLLPFGASALRTIRKKQAA
jgi:hypothetical protein